MTLRQLMLMLKGKMWSIGELFTAVGDALSGSKAGKRSKRTQKSREPASKGVSESNLSVEKLQTIKKARMRAMLSAIENGALKSRN
jgi:hypothetical protein